MDKSHADAVSPFILLEPAIRGNGAKYCGYRLADDNFRLKADGC